MAGPAETEPAVGEDGEARPLVVLLIETGAEGALDEHQALRRAVRTELNDVAVDFDAQIVAPVASLDQRLASAESVRTERGALLVVWVEARAEGRVLDFVAEPGLVRRPLPGASAEAAAVVIRYFVADLAAGRALGFGVAAVDDGASTRTGSEGREAAEPERTGGERPTPDSGEPSPPDTPGEDTGDSPEPALLLGDRDRVALGAGYLGQTWVYERPWEHGAELTLGWRHPLAAAASSAGALRLGASYQIAPAYQSETPTQTSLGLVWFRVRRAPAALYAGYQHEWPALDLLVDASVRVGLEVNPREAFSGVDGSGTDSTGRLDLGRARVSPFVEPRLGLSWVVSTPVAVFVAAGLRVMPLRHEHTLRLESDEGVTEDIEYLRPRTVAPTVLVGLGVYLGAQ